MTTASNEASRRDGDASANLDADVLFVAYNRPGYTAKSLPSLLESASPGVRIWIWQNGPDQETLEVVRSYKDHPFVHRYHEEPENVGLYPAVAWVLGEGNGRFVSKVDDDCTLPADWVSRLVAIHERNPDVGVLGCWRFQDEDFDEELASKKLRQLEGTQLLENLWVEGSGFLLKRRALDVVGGLRRGEGLPLLFKRTARAGFINGWVYPFIHQDHMDDPRSPNTLLRTDDDLLRNLPISAQRKGVRDLASWTSQLRQSARFVQAASVDLADYYGPIPRVRECLHEFRLAVRRIVAGLR